jgi:hypothetical protein
VKVSRAELSGKSDVSIGAVKASIVELSGKSDVSIGEVKASIVEVKASIVELASKMSIGGGFMEESKRTEDRRCADFLRVNTVCT